MAWPVSARYRAMAHGYDQKHKIRVDVCEFDGTVVYPDLPIAPGGTVNVDETAQVRRTISFTVPTVPSGAAGSLVPVNQGDVLHPLSGYELRAYRGMVYEDGTEEMVPLGVFAMSKPVIAQGPGSTPGGTTGAGVTVAVTGNDRSSEVSLVTYQEPYVVPPNTDVATAIRDLFDTLLPGLTYVLMESGYVLPGATFGQNPSTTNDPFADALGMASTAGMELFFDEVGRVVLRPVAIPSTAPVITTYGFPASGAVLVNGAPISSRIITAGQTLDQTQEYDGLILTCNGPGGPPMQVNVGNTGAGTHVYMMTTDLLPSPGLTGAQNTTQAQTMANNQYQLIRRAYDTPTWTCAPDGSIAPGDLVDVNAPGIGVGDGYGVAQMTIPLDVDTAQTMTARPQEQAR